MLEMEGLTQAKACIQSIRRVFGKGEKYLIRSLG